MIRDHVTWRRRCLIAAGFAKAEARALAADERIDIHALLELTDRGFRRSWRRGSSLRSRITTRES